MHNKTLSDTLVRQFPASLLAAATALALSACGGGGNSASDASYTLGGTVSALTGSGMVLKSNGQTLSVGANASTFSFGTVTGSYAVSIIQQPDGETCAVANASGSSSGSTVNSVAITCRPYVLYVAEQTAGQIAQFAVASNGTLTPAATAVVATSFLPGAIAVSDDGLHAWVAYEDTNTLSLFTTGATGLLGSQNDNASALSTQDAIALGAGSKSLYAAENGAAKVSQFSIGSNGTLPSVPTTSVAAGVNPGAVVATADGAHLYVANTSANTISGYSLDANGVPTALSASTGTVSTSTYGSSPRAIAVNPNGGALYVTLSASGKLVQYNFDATSGVLTYAQNVATGTTPRGIAVTPKGTYAYVANYGSGTISQYTLSGGSITALPTPTVAAGTHPVSITISPDGTHAYATNFGDGTISQYAIGSDGTLSPLTPATVSSNGAGPVAAAIR